MEKSGAVRDTLQGYVPLVELRRGEALLEGFPSQHGKGEVLPRDIWWNNGTIRRSTQMLRKSCAEESYRVHEDRHYRQAKAVESYDKIHHPWLTHTPLSKQTLAFLVATTSPSLVPFLNKSLDRMGRFSSTSGSQYLLGYRATGDSSNSACVTWKLVIIW